MAKLFPPPIKNWRINIEKINIVLDTKINYPLIFIHISRKREGILKIRIKKIDAGLYL